MSVEPKKSRYKPVPEHLRKYGRVKTQPQPPTPEELGFAPIVKTVEKPPKKVRDRRVPDHLRKYKKRGLVEGDPNNPVKAKPKRLPYRTEEPSDYKKGRPRKYERILGKNELGKDVYFSVEVDKKRYWCVTYSYVLYDRTHIGSVAFATQKNMIVSMYDLRRMTGIQNLVVSWFYEFEDEADYCEFSRSTPLEESLLGVLQV